MTARIRLPFGGANASFEVGRLVEYLKASGREYVIQGQAPCSFATHRKKQSLDYWLRQNFAAHRDTKQAVTEVIEQLVETGLFEEGSFACPDSGQRRKGIRLKAER